MSLHDAQEFLQQLASDAELAKEDAVAHRRLLVELAREKGFEITEQDLAAAAREAQEEPYGELDDAALEGVVAAGTNDKPININMSFN